MHPPENLVSFRIWKINHAAAIKTSLTPVNAWAVEDTNEACGDWGARTQVLDSGIWQAVDHAVCCAPSLYDRILSLLSFWSWMFSQEEDWWAHHDYTLLLLYYLGLYRCLCCVSGRLLVMFFIFGAGLILSKINIFTCYSEQHLTFLLNYFKMYFCINVFISCNIKVKHI